VPSNTTPPSGLDWRSLWQKFGRAGLGATLVAVLTPLLLLSETRIKDTVEAVFGGCLFVIDVRPGATPDLVEVQGYMTGKPPTNLNLTFKARQGVINTLEFRNGVLVRAPTPYSSRVLHPLAGQKCPGELCRTPMEILKPAELMTIRLPSPSPSFDYLFDVRLSDTASAASPPDERVAVYSIAGTSQDNVCRVESANAFNYLVRLDKIGRFVAYCMILLALTMLLIVFRAWKGQQ
jgi:hypothetical protein